MSQLTDRIKEMVVVLADLKTTVDLLEREQNILAKQNVDLRRRLKLLQPVGRSE